MAEKAGVPGPTDISVDDLYSALAAADKAGNTADAQQIAQMIQARESAAPAASAPAGAPQISNPLIRYPAMIGSALLKGATGAADLVASPYNPFNPAGNLWKLGSEAYTAATGKPSAPMMTSQQAGNVLGVIDNPRLEPQGLGENLLTGASTALPYAAVDIASGGAATPALLATAAAGAGAEAAHQYDKDSVLLPIMAGMLGGAGIGSLQRTVKNFGNVRNARKALDAADNALENFKDSLPTARFDVGQAFNNAKKLATDNWDAFKTAALAERDAVSKGVADTITGIASKFSPAQDLEEAGTRLQGAARNWLSQTMPAKVSALWKPVDDAVVADTPVDLGAFRNALSEINKSAGKLEPVARLLKPGLPAQIGKTLSAMDEAAELTGSAQPFTWGEVSKLRTTLGDAMSDPVVVKDVGQQNLARLYATLTADMRKTAGAAGAADAFDAANKGSAALFQIAEGPMAKLVSGKTADRAADPAPGKMAAGLLAAGGRDSGDLSVLRQELGDDLNHLGAVALKSGSWQKLHPGSQEALMPDQVSRGAVDLALQQKSAADAALADALATGRKTHQQNLEIADLARRQGNLNLTNSMRSLVKQKQEAKETLEGLSEDRAAGLKHGIGGLFGTAAGGELGILGLNALGLPGSDIVHGAIGSTIGMAAPTIARAVKRGVRNTINDPASLRYPALGAVAGSAWEPQLVNPQNPFNPAR